ncbi:hypothetical protein WJX84_006879 [Apatococcus fuscideae]|uniref:FHA domain-containing protein n=1 Tax=Apatococcus fuscideae TaxID=2026836 RepID=A0AAW1S1A1_9CHLO
MFCMHGGKSGTVFGAIQESSIPALMANSSDSGSSGSSSSSSSSSSSGSSSGRESKTSTSNSSSSSERSGSHRSNRSGRPPAPEAQRQDGRHPAASPSFSPPKERVKEEKKAPSSHRRSHSRERSHRKQEGRQDRSSRRDLEHKRSRKRSRSDDRRPPPRHDREKRRRLESPPGERSRARVSGSHKQDESPEPHARSSRHRRNSPPPDLRRDHRRRSQEGAPEPRRTGRDRAGSRHQEDREHSSRGRSRHEEERSESRRRRDVDEGAQLRQNGGRADRRGQREEHAALNGGSWEGRSKGGRASQFDLEDMPPPPPPPPAAEMAAPPPPPPPAAGPGGAPGLGAPQGGGPNYELSGMLAAETNKVAGVEIKYNEPPEARKPSLHWRLYCFKGDQALGDPLPLHRQSCYFFGKERRVVDVPTDHPSCSRQHAVLQYRLVESEGLDGMMRQEVKPYLLDLGSTNGTYINHERIEAERYHELREQDLLKFGNSSRDYVLLHADSLA